MECPTCHSPVSQDNPSHRGLLINAIARLSSELVADRERLRALQNARPAGFARQERVLRSIVDLKKRIEVNEAVFTKLEKLNEEIYVTHREHQ